MFYFISKFRWIIEFVVWYIVVDKHFDHDHPLSRAQKTVTNSFVQRCLYIMTISKLRYFFGVLKLSRMSFLRHMKNGERATCINIQNHIFYESFILYVFQKSLCGPTVRRRRRRRTSTATAADYSSAPSQRLRG